MKLMNSSQYATAMAQAALNDGLDPVAYAANYGIDLNAASVLRAKVTRQRSWLSVRAAILS